MAHLFIKNFSCIDRADVTLNQLTILIGPQASGKSVISKLMYFFQEAIESIYRLTFEMEETNLQKYEQSLSERFQQYFPAEAWGLAGFEISFKSGPLIITIKRYKPRKDSHGSLRFTFSDSLEDLFNSVQKQIKDVEGQSEKIKEQDRVNLQWEVIWRTRQAAEKKFKEILGKDFIGTQFFIPAGRSFFTNMGKAVVAFEHGGVFDPLTIKFGQAFVSMKSMLRGGHMRFHSPRKSDEQDLKEIFSLRDKLSEQLFCGIIKADKNDEYIEASDGRKIFFSIMSSGQQELLPLWLVLNDFLDGISHSSMLYIEEPEAHLFPSAQDVLTEYLAFLLGGKAVGKMFITTHSPYILAKINNLIKASSVAAKSDKKTQAEIEKVIPRLAWLKSSNVCAYAIVDRKLISIMDKDGYIDADYLDEVSNHISTDLNKLLEIEYMK